MQTKIKRYNILIKGKVQHIGYRAVIENNARKLDIKGYVFNDVDGSVKIACEGFAKSIDTFINSLTGFSRLEIDSIEKKEVHEELYLPSVFSRVATDDFYEFSKKFDIGINYFDAIKKDTGDMKNTLGNMETTLGSVETTLGNMETTLGSIESTMTSLESTMGAFVIEQREHNKQMDNHNSHLEKILERIANK